MDPISATLLFFLICLISLALGGLAFVYSADPNRRKRKLIHNQARQEYQNARGTLHLKMLIPARNNLKKRASQIDQKISSERKEIDRIGIKRDDALRLALEKHIIETHFHVPGIGESLKLTIINHVFKGRLTDLYHAQHMVHGIGESRQYSINVWVNRFLETIEERMKEDFPGKQEIVKHHKTALQARKAKVIALENEKSQVVHLIAKANEEIDRLSKIKVEHFEAALVQPGAPSKQIDEYLIGSFAEWDVVPQWFQGILEVGNSDV
jgi:hypothetical protein